MPISFTHLKPWILVTIAQLEDLMKLHACSRQALAALLWRLCSVGQCGGWGGPP
jgi:hypothetical protein